MRHDYTLAPLSPDDPRFQSRDPGVGDIERLFPWPVSVGRGSLAIEGGVSVVAGPGMGKTSLLARLAAHLDRSRRLATALVSVPTATEYPGEDGFYGFLGELVQRTRAALGASGRLREPRGAPVAAVLQAEPAWDAPTRGCMTPRGFAQWIATLGGAAVHTPGVCLLLDDLDHVQGAAWKAAFVAALRFTFQTSAGLTPVYGLWTLFADEALSGSNHFRNVTRPVFLRPLPMDGRRALVSAALAALPEPTVARVLALAGGHPLLLHKVLGDLAEALPDDDAASRLSPSSLDAALGPERVAGQHALARQLVDATPGLAAAVRQLDATPDPDLLSRGLVASGLAELGPDGRPAVPERIREAVYAAG